MATLCKNMKNISAPKMFIIYEVFVITLFFLQYFVMSDIIKTDGVNESDINYTVYNTFYYDLYQNTSFANDVDMNKSFLSNSSVEVFESSLSVTEDSDTSLQAIANRELSIPDLDICNCDLSVSVCDINCCCDPDCSEEDVQIFSECSHQVLTLDENYCYQKDIIFRNNTVYKMVKNPNNPLFCIVHDNFKHHLHFKDMPVLKSHRDIISVLKYKYKSTYSWDTESESMYDTREPKAGSPIYITYKKSDINIPWSLPSSCLNDICSCREEVRHLVDFTSSCYHVIEDVRSECERSDVLSGDQFTDFCLADQGAPLQANASDGVVSCALRSEKRPRRGSSACEDVVRHVRFRVEQGTGVSAEFEYGSVPFGTRVGVAQSYSVEFSRNNATGRKSGNPGYQVGLPVLAASNGSYLVPLPEGLTVLTADEDGFCGTRRHTVGFGMNWRSGCTLKLSGAPDCARLQTLVAGALLGRSGRHVFLGAFGNANASRPGDWIEAFHGGEEEGSGPECSLSLGLRIHVVFASVGPFADPQHKIVGVRYLHSTPERVDPSSAGLRLTTSVGFFDVTTPAVQRYAKVPTIEANLPADFFYPFLYGRTARAVALAPVVVMAIAVLATLGFL